MSPPDIALIGCGKMGSALVRGWLAAKTARRIHIIDPAGVSQDLESLVPDPLLTYRKIEDFVEKAPAFDVCVVAVKPQTIEDVCQKIRPAIPPDALVLSIAAGRTIESLYKYLGHSQAVVRAMPNTPASIGHGISVAVAGAHVTKEQRQRAEMLLAAVGVVEWINDESLLDAVTALSGSGPAYVFLLIEVLAKAGQKTGLDPALAMRLARQTVIGAAALAEKENEITAERLRKDVTSPGGTTEAALDVLMQNGAPLQALFDRALSAAKDRSWELRG